MRGYVGNNEASRAAFQAVRDRLLDIRSRRGSSASDPAQSLHGLDAYLHLSSSHGGGRRVPDRKNCRTSVKMIEEFYASHIKNMVDASVINVRRSKQPKARTSKAKRRANADSSIGGSMVLGFDGFPRYTVSVRTWACRNW
jgi:hypothetical protein